MKLLRMRNLIFLILIMVFISTNNLIYAGEWDILLDNESDINVEMLEMLDMVIDKNNYKTVNDYELVGAYSIGTLIKNYETLSLLKDSVRGQFKDITGIEWYSKEIGLASSLNMVQGYPDNTFRGNAKVSRIEFMTMLARATRGQAYYQRETLMQMNGDVKASLHAKNKVMTDS